MEEPVRKLPPEDRPYLRHLLRLRPQAVEPRHERVGERRRDVLRRRHPARLDHRLGQLLDEERHPVGPRHDHVHHRVGQRAACGHAGHHLAHVLPGKTAQRELRVMGPECPRRPELRPCGVEEEKRRRRPLLDEELLELEGRGIDPLEVLDEDDERLEARRPEHPGGERGEEPPSRHVRRGQHRRVALGDGEIEQRRDERQRPLGIEPCRPERALERRAASLRRVLARPGTELL